MEFTVGRWEVRREFANSPATSDMSPFVPGFYSISFHLTYYMCIEVTAWPQSDGPGRVAEALDDISNAMRCALPSKKMS